MTKYQQLVALLIKRTRAGTAGWEPTSRNAVFSLSLPDYGVWISMVDSEQGSHDVLFQIVNSSGAVIDSFRDVDVAANLSDKRASYEEMERLYQDARRQALGVDKALDSLIEELGKP